MKFEKYLVSFIKKYKTIIKVVHDFCLDVDPDDYLFDVFDIDKSFE